MLCDNLKWKLGKKTAEPHNVSLGSLLNSPDSEILHHLHVEAHQIQDHD